MSRETHVRFSEGVGVGFPRATRPCQVELPDAAVTRWP